jgi:hypothetical protein
MSKTPTELIDFEAKRIISTGLRVLPEHQADYMRVQIVAAIHKAPAHGRGGSSDADPPRATREIRDP